jgi:hypothetical protein
MITTNEICFSTRSQRTRQLEQEVEACLGASEKRERRLQIVVEVASLGRLDWLGVYAEQRKGNS